MSGYISLNYTGVPEIDAICTALENAGDAYHGTDMWGDEGTGADQRSELQKIQAAIDKAAAVTETKIARVCHEVNRAYCQALGDNSQVPWDEAPEWQQVSAITGVMFVLANPDAQPSANHDSWLAEKLAQGWKYGPVKNPDAKEHPCCVAYDELPAAQKAKDYIFRAVVKSLSVG